MVLLSFAASFNCFAAAQKVFPVPKQFERTNESVKPAKKQCRRESMLQEGCSDFERSQSRMRHKACRRSEAVHLCQIKSSPEINLTCVPLATSSSVFLRRKSTWIVAMVLPSLRTCSARHTFSLRGIQRGWLHCDASADIGRGHKRTVASAF